MITSHVIRQLPGGTGKAFEPLSQGGGGGRGIGANRLDLHPRAFVEGGGTFQHHDAAFDRAVVFHAAQVIAAGPRIQWFWPQTLFFQLLAALFFTTSLCAAETRLTFPTVPGYPGVTVPVPVRLTRATNVTAGQFDVAYDPARIVAAAPELGFGAPNHVLRTREISPGVHRMLFYSLNNAVTSNRVTTTIPLTLPANERVGSGPILPGNVKLSRPDATSVTPVTVTPGEVFVVPAYVLPDGRAQFFFQSQPGTNYVVQASVNLVDWTNISTNMATSDFLDLVDADAVFYPWRFYRLRAE